MKKFLLKVFAIFIISAFALSACGTATVIPPQNEIVNQQTGEGIPSGSDAGGTTQITPSFANANNLNRFLACEQIALHNADASIQEVLFPNGTKVPAKVTPCNNDDGGGSIIAASTLTAKLTDVTILAYIATAYGIYLIVRGLDEAGIIEDVARLIPAAETSYSPTQEELAEIDLIAAITSTIDGIGFTGEPVETEINQLLADMTTAATLPTVFPSMKHTESDNVKTALLTLASKGILKSRGDCRSSGSVCIWAGANFSNMTGSIMISFVACTRVAYAVLTAPLIFAPSAELILTGKLINVANNAYIDPTVATWTAAFLLGVGGTTGKGYNPSEAITFGQGWASLEYKRQQYGINLVVAEIRLPIQ